MFGRDWAYHLLLAFVLVSSGGTETGSDRNETGNRKCGPPRTGSEIAGESAKNRLAEFNGGTREIQNFRNDDCNFAGGEIESDAVINKCCPGDSYFDVDNYNCVESAGEMSNETISGLFFFHDDGNESNYSFVESVPDCGSDSVLSVSVVAAVQIRNSEISADGKFFSRYCLDSNPDYPNRSILLTCQDPKSFCERKLCLRKCCPLKESYEQSGRKCRKTNRPFKPKFFDFPSLDSERSIGPFEMGLYLGDACKEEGKYLLEREQGETSYLDPTGTLCVPMYKKCFGEDDFCLEHVRLDNYAGIGSFLCFSDGSDNFENSQLQYILLSLGLIVSCMFLLITFLVYTFSPNSRNLYGKASMCYIACLFTAYLSLAVVELISTKLNKTLCICMGYLILFSFLAAFFWLNVISYDIWKTFRVVRSPDRSNAEKDKKRIRFLWYSLYAWTFPSVITTACAVVNQIPNFPYDAMKPDIGEENCWFSRQKKGIYFFFITPIVLIIASNVIFYLQTAWRIWKVKSDINKMGKQKRKKFTTNKDQFLINGKLFIVMGITWSLEIVSFFAPHPVWYVTDTANALHGVFIFAVFVLKKKVLRQISQQMRYPLKSMKQLSSQNSYSPDSTKNVSQDTNTKEKSQSISTGTTSRGNSEFGIRKLSRKN